jgi:hypothetical protein
LASYLDRHLSWAIFPARWYDCPTQAGDSPIPN